MSIEMRYITINGIEQPCAQLILGSMMLHDEKMDFSASLLDAYTALGGNMIDTAHVYGANSAQAIGRWMKERKNRSDIILIGKGAHPDKEGPRVNKEAIEQDLLESLERMQTDYVDIFMLHRDDPDKEVAYILESLQEQLESKRCRALGVSNWTIERIQEANDYAARNGLISFACSSPNLSLAKPNEPRWAGCISVDNNDAEWHKQSQLPLLSWSSQAGGFFTGRFSPDQREDKEAVRVYYSEVNWERLRRADALAKQKGVSANHIALAYVLLQPFPSSAIIGPNLVEELHSSAEALNVRITQDEINWLDLNE
jgi:aryl-alcohol dehydrogenase-like predicted oxidoreductase